MLRLVDTHCHLYFNLFDDDLRDVIHRAQDAGVEKILLPGIDLASSWSAVELADTYPNLYTAVGIHPNNVGVWDSETLNELARLAAHPKVMAIGEIGLDYYRDRTPVDEQKKALLDQLSLAKALEKPVILHSRSSTWDVLEILNQWRSGLPGTKIHAFPGVFHAFEGNLAEALLAIENHFMIGIGGPVTYKNAVEKQKLAKSLPLSHLVLETDAPFLSPHPFRGQRNEPARINEIAVKIALLRDLTVEEIAHATSRNAAQLFKWSSAVEY